MKDSVPFSKPQINFIREELEQFYIEKIDPRFSRNEAYMVEMMGELQSFKHLVDERFTEIRNDMNDRFDFLFKSYETLRIEHGMINHQLKGYDQRLEKIEAELANRDLPANLIEEIKSIKLHTAAFMGIQEDHEASLENYENNTTFEKNNLAFHLKMIGNRTRLLEERVRKLEEGMGIS